MTKPLVTVVITTYRRPEKIASAIDSVIGQTYGNIEIIVVDDNPYGSEEHKETAKVCAQYPKVNYIKNAKNLGGGLSRNIGIESATGSFVAFLDDDDVYLPGKVAKQVALFQESEDRRLGLVYCYANRINSNGELIGGYDNDFEGSPIYEHMLGCIAGTSLWLARKDVLVKVGMFDDVPSKQDSTLILKMLVSKYRVARVPERLVDYHEHQGDGISGTKLSNIEGITRFRAKCERYYSLLNVAQRKKVSYNFSKQLIVIYAVNSLRSVALNELRNMAHLYPFKLDNGLSLLKILMPSLYRRFIAVVGHFKTGDLNRPGSKITDGGS